MRGVVGTVHMLRLRDLRWTRESTRVPVRAIAPSTMLHASPNHSKTYFVLPTSQARYGHSAVVATGAGGAAQGMVVFGGEDASGNYCNDVGVLLCQPKRMSSGAAGVGGGRVGVQWRRWRCGGAAPAARVAHSAVRYGNL